MDSQTQQDQDIRVLIHDKIDESQRLQDLEIQGKIDTGMNNTLSKAAAEMQTYCDAAVKASADRVFQRTLDENDLLQTRFRDALARQNQLTQDEMNGRFDDLKNQNDILKKANHDEVENQIGKLKGSVGNMDDVHRVIDSA